MNHEWIDTAARWAAVMEAVGGESTLALDFEMENHYRRYGLHMALIQISSPAGRNWLIDPLAGLDLTPLGARFADAAVEWIVHDADFDRRALRQVWGWRLERVFDTRIAAQLCGFRRIGLAALVKDLLGHELNKSLQTTDWMKRPLPRAAVEYAARDTTFLFPLQAALTARLTELGRLDWAQDEFMFQARAVTAPAPPEPAHFRMKGGAQLTPRQLAVLAALVRFRDQLAQALNRPVHYVARDAQLLVWARQPPAGLEALRRVAGLHPALLRAENAQRLAAAVAEGLAAPEETHPHWRPRAPRIKGSDERLKAMQAWRREQAAPLDLEPHLLLDNDVLEWCARHPGEVPPAPVMGSVRAWQRRLVWPGFTQTFG